MDPSLLSVRVGRLVVDVTSAIRKRSVFDPWCCLPLFRSPVYLPTTSALEALPVLKESRFIREDVVWFVVWFR